MGPVSSAQCPTTCQTGPLPNEERRQPATGHQIYFHQALLFEFSNDKTMLPKDPNTELYFINVKTFTVDLAEQKSSDFITISNWRLHCVPQHNNNQHHTSVLSIHLRQNLKTVRFLLWIWIWKRLWYACVWITAKVLPHMFDYLREVTSHMSTCVFEKDWEGDVCLNIWERLGGGGGGGGAVIDGRVLLWVLAGVTGLARAPLGDHWPNWVMEKKGENILCVNAWTLQIDLQWFALEMLFNPT